MDAQGFQINNKFYMREFSFVKAIKAKSFNVVPELNISNIGRSTRLCIDFQTEKIHGLKLRTSPGTFHLKNSNIDSFIPVLIETLTNKEKPLVAVKNQQLASILRGLNLNFVNMEKGSFSVPSLKMLDEASTIGKWMCSLHTVFKTEHKRCGLRKSLMLWSWLNKKLDEERELSLAVIEL